MHVRQHLRHQAVGRCGRLPRLVKVIVEAASHDRQAPAPVAGASAQRSHRLPPAVGHRVEQEVRVGDSCSDSEPCVSPVQPTVGVERPWSGPYWLRSSASPIGMAARFANTRLTVSAPTAVGATPCGSRLRALFACFTNRGMAAFSSTVSPSSRSTFLHAASTRALARSPPTAGLRGPGG